MTDAAPHVAAPRVAVVDDDEDMRFSTAQALSLAGFAVDLFPAAPPALAAIDADYPGAVVTDVRMPHVSGIELFRTLRQRDETLPVLLMTGHGDVAMAVDALKAGAWDFLTKPFDPAVLVAAVTRAVTARALALDNRRLRARAEADDRGGIAAGLIGETPAIRRLRDMVPMLADTDLDLFIEGESGTGKELLARLIHRSGRRARHRFLAVACGGLPDALAEADLFGPARETGLMAAHRGTLLLDDLDQASRALQARLVPLVEERAIRPAAAREAVPLDLRIIATAGAEDARGADAVLPALFYRLAAVRLSIPPLRDRREDVPLLFAHLAGEAAARARRPVPALTAAVRDRLAAYDWPGNVRELGHFAERFVLGLEGEAAPPGEALPLPDRVAAFERDAIVAAVLAADGEIGVAIERLGLPRKTFYYKVQRHDIDLAALKRRRPG